MSTKPLRDRGTAPIEVSLGVGVLLLPIAVIVMMLPQWPEAKNVAESAALQAATIYANAPTPDAGAIDAVAATNQTQANYNRTLELQLDGAWCRGCTVTATVTVTVPAIHVPFAGSSGTFTYTATSSARVEDYASR